MTDAIIVGIVASIAATAVLLAADRVVEWFGKRFWGKLTTSSRVAALVAVMAIVTGLALPTRAVTDTVWVWASAGVAASAFCLLLTLQISAIIRDRKLPQDPRIPRR